MMIWWYQYIQCQQSVQMSLLTNSYMSAKSVLQTLEDPKLIRLFLDFVAAYRLNYQKHKKQISYKCFEAAWVLPMAKATGYGRTQTQAYKNALKNLLELLMEDPSYVQYFTAALSTAPSQPKVPTSHSKAQLKTEGHQPANIQYGQYSTAGQKRQTHAKAIHKSTSKKGDWEVEEVKSRINLLTDKLNLVLSENQMLKEELRRKGRSTQKESSVEGNQQGRVEVPRLNLSVLPNYHKKSEKCLNDMLLAVYQEKHGVQKLY